MNNFCFYLKIYVYLFKFLIIRIKSKYLIYRLKCVFTNIIIHFQAVVVIDCVSADDAEDFSVIPRPGMRFDSSNLNEN